MKDGSVVGHNSQVLDPHPPSNSGVVSSGVAMWSAQRHAPFSARSKRGSNRQLNTALRMVAWAYGPGNLAEVRDHGLPMLHAQNGA